MYVLINGLFQKLIHVRICQAIESPSHYMLGLGTPFISELDTMLQK